MGAGDKGAAMPKVLFVCTHNSARSQMAEAYLRKFGGDRFEVESAGLEPGKLNPYVVRALLEDGIDISGKETQGVFDLLKQGRFYNFVVAVCSKEAAQRCPIFPGHATRLVWSFPDPSTFTGPDDQVMAQVREVRDAIRDRVRQFSQEVLSLA
jgi:arsenate reductase